MTAPTEVAAGERCRESTATWCGQYPAIGVNSWNELTPFPDYGIEVLRVV